MSMQLHTGIDYFLSMPLDELNEIAESVKNILEEVTQRNGQK